MKTRFSMKKLVSIILVFLFIPAVSISSSFEFDHLLTGNTGFPFCIRFFDSEYQSLSVFDGNRLEQLNRVMKHIAAELTVDGENSQAILLADEEPMLTVYEKQDSDGTTCCYILDDETALVNQGKKPTIEDHELMSFLEEIFFPVNSQADGLYQLFDSLSGHFEEYIKETKTDLNLSGYGRASKRINIVIPADYAEEKLSGDITKLTDSDSCRTFLNELIFAGQQKIALLYDKEDKLIRINYDGKLGKTTETLRNVSVVWKCLRSDNLKRDNFILKTPAVKGYDRDNIVYDRTVDRTDSEKHEVTWDLQLDRKRGTERIPVRFTGGITLIGNDISGKAEYSKKQEGKTTSVVLIPALTKENDDVYNGTLEITEYSGKIVKMKLLTRMLLGQSDGITIPESVQKETNDLNSNPEKAEEVFQQKLVKRLMQRIAGWPAKDLEFFTAGLSEEVLSELLH